MLKDVFRQRVIPIILIPCLIMATMTGCGINSEHLEMTYSENENESITGWDDVSSNITSTWDNAYIVSWEEIDDYSDWVYSELVFDDILEEMPIVECRILDYRSNGIYFDGEQIYSMVGNKFDVNSFVAKYAVGTGVILICVILNVVTAGVATPVACFIAGAADTSVNLAVKGAAFGAAAKAITSAIKSGGDFEETLYGALEGSADGYMWGAIYGAVTGGFSSKFCFAEGTLVHAEAGEKPIQEIKVGECVYSFDSLTENYSFKPVTQVNIGESSEMVFVNFDGEIIESTPSHPFLTDHGWMAAGCLVAGMKVLSTGNYYRTVTNVSCVNYENAVPTYSLCVDESHSFIVGDGGIVVHNRCKPNEKYANSTYKFSEGSANASKYPDGVPFDADGYPDFSQYAIKTVKFDYPSPEGKSAKKCLTGNYSTDFDLANSAAGYATTPAGYTWHHHQDMQTMQLVPQDIHSVAFGGVAHGGGDSLLENFFKLAEAA